MSDTLITVVAIFLAVALLIVVPLQITSQRVDTMSKLDVDELTSKFVDQIRLEGAITKTNYYGFKQSLSSTGNTYDVNMEVKILDENPGKKTTQAEKDKIGENVYYSVYTSQIEEAMENSETEKYSLHEGDFVSVTVRNTNLTIGQQIKNFAYKITGNDTYTIAASKSGLVVANGSTSTVISKNVDKPEIQVVLKENDTNGKVITKQNSNSTEITNNWTNKNVYVEMSSKENYNLDLIYFTRYKTNSQDYFNYNKLQGNNFIETKAGETVYQVFWKTNLLEKYSDIKDVRIRIDRTAPTINQVIASTEKENTGKVTVNAVDQGGSGISGYFYKWSAEGENPSKPGINDSGWVTSNSIIAYPQNNNQKCTVWVKDNAGNISNAGSGVVRNVVYPITGVTLNGAIIKTGEKQTINATLQGGTDYKNIKFEISDTSIATISNNGTQALVNGLKPGKVTAKCIVTNYNGTTQTANAIITVTSVSFSPNGKTYGLSYVDKTAKVTLQTNVIVSGNPNKTEYAWSNSNSQTPTNGWKQFNSGDEIRNIVSNVGNYYLWIRVTDQYNNSVLYVSNLFYVKYKIPDVTGNASISCTPSYWTKSNVTVNVSTNLNEFILQTSLDGVNWAKGGRTVSNNCKVYVRFYSEKQKEAGNAITVNINNIDKKEPTIVKDIYKKSVTNNSVKLGVTLKDDDSGYSKVIWYYKTANSNSYSKLENVETKMNGYNAGNRGNKEIERDITNLTAGSSYNFYAEIYDVAGNVKRTPDKGAITVTVSKKNASITTSSTSGSTCIGKGLQYSVTENTSGGTLSVSSSNTSIATATMVNNTVLVTPKGVGKAYITVKSAETSTYNSASSVYTVTITNHNSTTGGSKVSDATCTSAAVYHHKCSICGKNLSSTYSSGSALGHNFSEDKSEKIGTWKWVETPNPEYIGGKQELQLSYISIKRYARFSYESKAQHAMRVYISSDNPYSRVDICLGMDRNATSAGTALEAYPNGNWKLWSGGRMISQDSRAPSYDGGKITSYIEWGHRGEGGWIFTISNVSYNKVTVYGQDCKRYFCTRCSHYEDRYKTNFY